MNNGPLPTRLVFLSDLPNHAHGTKVRFMGCVTRYIIPTGVLELQHAFPLHPHISIVAMVDVKMVLETLKREDTLVGAWVNVLGYVEEVLKAGKREQRQGQGEAGTGVKRGVTSGEARRALRVKVQAIMLWSAGGVKIGEYERTLEERLKLEKES